MELWRDVTGPSQYGPLQAGFRYGLRRGYTALIGPNNAGKSTLLQLIFREMMDDAEVGAGRVAFIPPDRQYVSETTQTAGRTLDAWNGDLVNHVRNRPHEHGSGTSPPPRPELTRVLMHASLVRQVQAMNDLLERLGLRPFDLVADQNVQFGDEVFVASQGTGLRGVLPIVAAITNPNLSVLLIDEPELSLEPRLQKVLRDILIEASQERVVVVATHSHLFLRRDLEEANQVVGRTPTNEIAVHTLATTRELYDAVFDLLGSSTEDLFFPSNYLIVEGASDQAIVEKVITLLGAPPPTIKVLAARGIDAVRDTVESVYRASVPLIVNDSPYKGRVVALVDEPRNPESQNFKKLDSALGDRLHILDAPSMEEYMPEAIYAHADRDKDADRTALANADRLGREALKTEISSALAEALTEADFDSIPTIVLAAQDAIDRAT
jgi:energy-coupling factor transporter ATP-binding protein EcfA2